MNLELSVKHVIQIVLKQIQIMHQNIQEINENEDLTDNAKRIRLEYIGVHMAVMSIILEQLSEKTLELYPDAKPLVEWAHQNYQHGIENKFIIPCSCDECCPKSN